MNFAQELANQFSLQLWQTEKVIDLFAGHLILGISDEMSSTGNIDRIKYVGEIVDKHNLSC